MNIEKTIEAMEENLEQYEETNAPDDRLDLKQTITGQIKSLRAYVVNEGKKLSKVQEQTITDIEEILSY